MTEEEESFEDDEIYPLVIDHGSCTIKAGFGGDDAPRSVPPTIIAKDSRPNSNCSPQCCDEVYSMSRYYYSYRKSYPIQRGIIKNINDMEYIWHHIFYNELRVDPIQHPILLSDKPLNNKQDREEMIQIMFEKFKFPKLHIIADAILALYASGRRTGIILDSGYDSTNIVAIQDSQYISNSVKQLEFGGKHLTKHLETLLTQRGYSFTTTAERQIVNDIKEKFCYVALNYEDELEELQYICSPFEKNYELPDGQVITIGDYERMKGDEPLFKPNMIGYDVFGIHEMMMQSIRNCKYEIRKELLCNVIMNGGSTMFDGLDKRLKKELEIFEENGYFVDTKLLTNGYLRELANKYDNISCKDIAGIIGNNIDKIDHGLGWKIKIIAPPERKYATWIGGSILTLLSSFEEMWILHEEYNEYGASVLDKKCHDFH